MKKQYNSVVTELTGSHGTVDLSRINTNDPSHLCYFYSAVASVQAGADVQKYRQQLYSHLLQGESFHTLKSFDTKAYGNTAIAQRDHTVVSAFSAQDLIHLMTLHNQFKRGWTLKDIDAIVTNCRTLSTDPKHQTNPIIVQAKLDLVKFDSTTRKFRLFDDIFSVISLGFVVACAITFIATTVMSSILSALLITGVTLLCGCMLIPTTIAIKNAVEDRALA